MSSDKKDISAYRGTRKMMRTMYLCKYNPHQHPLESQNMLLLEWLSRWRLCVT